MKASAAFGQGCRIMGQRAPHLDDLVSFVQGVSDGSPTIGSGQIQTIRHRPPEIWAGIETRQATPDAHQTAHVARIAVGVPAGRVDNGHGLLEAIPTVEQRQDNEGMVGHHVAVAAILVIAIVGDDAIKSIVPSVVLAAPVAQVADQAIDERIIGYDRGAHIE